MILFANCFCLEQEMSKWAFHGSKDFFELKISTKPEFMIFPDKFMLKKFHVHFRV